MTVEERALRALKMYEDHARGSPLQPILPASVADMMHWVVTGDVRRFSEESDREILRATARQVAETGELTLAHIRPERSGR